MEITAIEVKPEGTFIVYENGSTHEVPIGVIKIFMNMQHEKEKTWKLMDLLDIIEGQASLINQPDNL